MHLKPYVMAFTKSETCGFLVEFLLLVTGSKICIQLHYNRVINSYNIGTIMYCNMLLKNEYIIRLYLDFKVNIITKG